MNAHANESASSMRSIRLLMGKELQRRRSSFMINAGVLVSLFGLFVFVSPTGGRWPEEAALGGVAAVLVVTLIMAVEVGLGAWSYEWKGDHNHLLLSLPVSGQAIFGAKLAAAALEIISVILGLKILLLLFARMEPGLLPTALLEPGTGLAGGPLASLTGFMLLMTVLTVVGIILAQFAWIVGALAPRAWLPAALGGALTGSWLLLRAMGLAGDLFAWLPRINWWFVVHVAQSSEHNRWEFTMTPEPMVVEMSTAPLAAVMLAAGLLYLLAAHLVERHAEI